MASRHAFANSNAYAHKVINNAVTKESGSHFYQCYAVTAEDVQNGGQIDWSRVEGQGV